MDEEEKVPESVDEAMAEGEPVEGEDLAVPNETPVIDEEQATAPTPEPEPQPTAAIREVDDLKRRIIEFKEAIRPLAMLEVEPSRADDFNVCVRGASIVTARDVRTARKLYMRKV